jgi:hypothetical protein
MHAPAQAAKKLAAILRTKIRLCAQCDLHGCWKACSRCRSADHGTYFCNAQCQRSGWPEHWRVCRQPDQGAIAAG